MKIATVLNVHNDPKLVLDTIDSVMTHMTQDVLVVIDGASTSFMDVELPTHRVAGFRHGCAKSPYRNVALGWHQVAGLWPDADWYCYLEYDCLVASAGILDTLRLADEQKIWMLGCDGHVDDKRIPLVESMFDGPFTHTYYFLGACQFISKRFMERLQECNFFERFLSLTNMYIDGFMPAYDGYDVSEHLYPTIARHFGGAVGVLSTWDRYKRRWHGNAAMYPIRWRPDIETVFPEATIYHPLKALGHPVREHYRKLRNDYNKNDRPSC